ncbi:MAG: septum formation protein Maf [Lachnospiraceae bacterium]|nr:septum formation protein Maf [Lachnospiraceae bacterium]
MKVILASASPRRKELLGQMCSEFECIPSKKEEKITKTLPEEVVCELSLQKAADIEGQIEKEENMLIIGSDTVVAYGDKIMGKPQDEADAYSMLSALQNDVHRVCTGVTLILYRDGERKVITFAETAKVEMYPMSDAQIKAYIATGEPMDKAGAYAIQGKCAVYIKGLSGEYNTVVGFPIARIYQELLKEGITLC